MPSLASRKGTFAELISEFMTSEGASALINMLDEVDPDST
jgi:hypothetical protein